MFGAETTLPLQPPPLSLRTGARRVRKRPATPTLCIHHGASCPRTSAHNAISWDRNCFLGEELAIQTMNRHTDQFTRPGLVQIRTVRETTERCTESFCAQISLSDGVTIGPAPNAKDAAWQSRKSGERFGAEGIADGSAVRRK